MKKMLRNNENFDIDLGRKNSEPPTNRATIIRFNGMFNSEPINHLESAELSVSDTSGLGVVLRVSPVSKSK
jgi:hypothetical protein